MRALINGGNKTSDKVLKAIQRSEKLLSGLLNVEERNALKRASEAAAMGDVKWEMVISASILAGLLSLLTSVAGLPEIKE